ncbi:MAG: FkbM family methyltransferase [Candidatus Korobacteraceae bacterium]
MFDIKQAFKAGFRLFGLEVQRLPGPCAPGRLSFSEGHDPYRDMRWLTKSNEHPVVFDVGANVGQSVERLKRYFAHPVIHAFEPAPDTFQRLREATKGTPDLILNNIALGRHSGTAELVENTESVMSSFLELGSDSWGAVKQKIPVIVGTLDDYCSDNSVDRIDILKLDTQGFELEVLSGGENLLRQGRIEVVFMEITFSELYRGLPSLDELYRFMMERGFSLVSFYDFRYQHHRLGWCDALFERRR